MVNLHDSRFGVSISQLLEQGTMLGNTYDEEGNLIGYVDFAPCMANYFTCCDPELGVYALTDDLITMLQSYGDAAGWFDPASENYLFGEQADLNPDSLWMFLLCVAV